MYTRSDGSVEEQCYDEAHIAQVLEIIKKNFEAYFDHFIESQAGKGISDVDFSKLQQKLGMKADKKVSYKNLTANYKAIIIEAVDDFEKDREDYKRIFDQKLLEDYDEDADTFKSKVLHNECPIIRKTIANRRAKELDKYRAAFSRSDADWLLEIVHKLCVFGDEYQANYNPETYEDSQTYKDLGMELLDTEDYTAYGVIGGGIKTHMLYKVHPAVFSDRSRNAIWALWY